MEPALLRPLGEMLKTVLLKLYAALDNPDFNLTVDTLRNDDDDEEFFLWHMQLLPRLTMPARKKRERCPNKRRAECSRKHVARSWRAARYCNNRRLIP